ncbi:MAG: NUDIX hydrolase [Patescibacteria group bacterium]
MRKPRVRKKKVARVIVLNELLEMLLVRQKTRKLWQFPGGVLGLNEDPLETAIRELREETNVRLISIRHIHTELIVSDLSEEEINCYVGIPHQCTELVPDGKEIDKLAWTSFDKAQDLPLTDTTKLLQSTIPIIGLFV